MTAVLETPVNDLAPDQQPLRPTLQLVPSSRREDVAATTSLDRDLNACGYGAYLEDPPETDESYTPNSEAPNWDYRVVYDVWVSASAFGAAGFGDATISYVHASPSKYPSDTVTVTPGPCIPTTCEGARRGSGRR